MTDPAQTPAPQSAGLFVAAGADRFGVQRGLGISTITFKVTPRDSAGLLILENTFHAKGGPARHLHYAQDEWFYAVEGAFLIEVGDDRRMLRPRAPGRVGQLHEPCTDAPVLPSADPQR